ncbi:M48 family metallopeptidase [Acidaminococcus sp.]|uniref:M48 family metallopeptidase n=1 Tax=Acidaminococcus sp. TaxID=1872103 RepID=UPI003D7EE07C
MGIEEIMENAQIVQSARRTIGFEVRESGTLLLRVPYGCPKSLWEQAVYKKEQWICRAVERVRTENREYHTLELREGETFLLFGVPCILHRVPGKGFRQEPGNLYMGTEEQRATLIRYLSARLGEVLWDLVRAYALVLGLPMPRVKWSRAHSRWGYCNYKGEIGFSWPLVFCPREVIAYVVVHELCHIRNMSHNKAFWQAVAQVLPDYREQENWLKVHRKVMFTL